MIYGSGRVPRWINRLGPAIRAYAPRFNFHVVPLEAAAACNQLMYMTVKIGFPGKAMQARLCSSAAYAHDCWAG